MIDDLIKIIGELLKPGYSLFIDWIPPYQCYFAYLKDPSNDKYCICKFWVQELEGEDLIDKIVSIIEDEYPEALKEENSVNLSTCAFDVASMYPERLFKKEEEETKGQMEEILKDVVNELNKEIDVKSDYYIYYRYLYDSIKADIYLAKKLNNAPSKLVAEVYEGDVLFNDKDWLIEKLEEKIDNLAPEALKQNDKYLRKLIRKVRKDLKEEEMPTSMHEFQFSSIAVVNSIPKVKRVTFSGPATIVFFEDGTKTVAKCHDPEKFDKWSGIAICICKKYYGKNFKKFFKEWDGDKELRKMERKEKKARKKMKNVKTHDDIFRENDKTMEELWIKEEGEDV